MEKVVSEEVGDLLSRVSRECVAARARERSEDADEASIILIRHFLIKAAQVMADLPLSVARAALQSDYSLVLDEAESVVALCFCWRFQTSFDVLREMLRALRSEIDSLSMARCASSQSELRPPGESIGFRTPAEIVVALKHRLAQLEQAAPSPGTASSDIDIPTANTTSREHIEKTLIDLQMAFRADKRTDGVGSLLPCARSFPGTSRLIATLQSKLETQDACEGFAGYQRDVKRLVARLRTAAGIRFRLVPGIVRSTLGGADHNTICPLSGSIAGCARFDRKSRIELRHLGSSETTTLPALRTTGERVTDSPPILISESVLTRAQYELLRRNLRRAHLPRLDELWSDDAVSSPVYLDGKLEGCIVLPRRETDPALKVPFYVAESIASSLDCTLIGFNCYDLMVGGIEREAHCFTSHDLSELQTCTWSESIDSATGRVNGLCTRIASRVVSSATTATGVELSQGPEWCSLTYASDSCEAKGSHVLRTATDFVTQHLLEEELTRNDIPFVGVPCSAYLEPSFATPVAAFRLAIPANSEAFEEVSAAIMLEKRRRGTSLHLYQLLSYAVRRTRDQVLTDLAPLRVDAWKKDELYGHLVAQFIASGFDLLFDAAPPHNFFAIFLYTSENISGRVITVPWRVGFSHAVPISSTSSEFRMNPSSIEEWLSRNGRICDEYGGFLQFEDIFEVPSTQHTPFSTVVKARIRLVRKGSTYRRVEFEVIDAQPRLS